MKNILELIMETIHNSILSQESLAILSLHRSAIFSDGKFLRLVCETNHCAALKVCSFCLYLSDLVTALFLYD